MAQSLKTVAYTFPTIASVTNNTLTNFTQITVSLPEGSKTFRKAWVEVAMDDIVTATGGTITTKTVDLRLGAAAYTSTANTQTLTNTGENVSLFVERDFTSHFTTNWTGTSMTCDARVQINQSTGTTLNMVNVSCILYITYEFDDTSATQVETKWIPLNAPVTFLPTTKTSHDTIPALDTYLPEASKVYRNIAIVTEANRNHSAATDHTVTYELSSLGTQVTGNYESALASDVWSRYVWNITSYITTNVTHTFNMWASLTARHHSPHNYMMVTYEFDNSTTTRKMNSLLLPMGIASPMGTAAADFQRADRELWVQEPNPTRERVAFYMMWQSTANEAGLNARIGTGSFVAYTNTGSGLVCGNKGLMIRNDAPTGLTFARGRNTLSVDIYNTSATQRGGNVGGYWMINYSSDIANGTHNHTVLWPIFTNDNVALTQGKYTTASNANVAIPETNHFITALGLHLGMMQGAVQQGATIKLERLAGEGGLIFEPAYVDISNHDSEMGRYDLFAQVRTLFKRWVGDTDTNRLALNVNRRFYIYTANAVSMPTILKYMITYHGITSTVADSVSGFSGTVTISAHRASGEKVLETTRAGDGAFSLTWYDNTEPLYIVASGSTSGHGRSELTLPVLDQRHEL